MFWFKGKEPEQSTKDKQIRELTSAFPSIKRPNQDDNLFEIIFEIDRKYNTLRIYLPNDFPTTKPALQVVGPVVHPWLDQYKRVAGCEKLTYWTKSSSLTEIVQETLSQLRNGQILSTHPPPQPSNQGVQSSSYLPTPAGYPQPTFQPPPPSYPIQNPNSMRINSTPLSVNDLTPNGFNQNQPPPSSMYSSPYHSNPSLPQPIISPTLSSVNQMNSGYDPRDSNENPHLSTRRPVSVEKLHIPLPAVPTSFPRLNDLSPQQLQRLLQDDAAVSAHISQYDCVDSLRTMRDQIRQSNTRDASENLSQETELRQLEKELVTLQNTLRMAANDYRLKLSRVEGKYTVDKSSLMKKFNESKDAVDETSENLSRDFVDGSTDLQSFIQNYITLRTNYHRMCLQASHAT